MYQAVEDFLEDVFSNILGGPRNRATAIYNSVFGIESKIRIIQAAATNRSGLPWDELPLLLKRVKAASEVRAKIAHARPVQNGGKLAIKFRMENGLPVEAIETTQITEPCWELHKDGKETVIFTVENLREEYDRFDAIFSDLIDFLKTAADTDQSSEPAGFIS